MVPTSTDEALENPAKKPITSPSSVRNTARAAIASSGCRPSTTLMTMKPMPISTSFMMMGKHFIRYMAIKERSQRKCLFTENRYGCPARRASSMTVTMFTHCAATVANAAPRTPRAGKPRCPKIRTQLRKTLAVTAATEP